MSASLLPSAALDCSFFNNLSLCWSRCEWAGGGGGWGGLALLLGHGEFLHAQLCGLVEGRWVRGLWYSCLLLSMQKLVKPKKRWLISNSSSNLKRRFRELDNLEIWQKFLEILKRNFNNFFWRLISFPVCDGWIKYGKGGLGHWMRNLSYPIIPLETNLTVVIKNN